MQTDTSATQVTAPAGVGWTSLLDGIGELSEAGSRFVGERAAGCRETPADGPEYAELDLPPTPSSTQPDASTAWLFTATRS